MRPKHGYKILINPDIFMALSRDADKFFRTPQEHAGYVLMRYLERQGLLKKQADGELEYIKNPEIA